ncbi:MAG: pantoate--beta-alanine ligase [Actinomycetota bacterium]
MEVIHRAAEFRDACEAARAGGRTVGFVATMGSFHEGHLSLIRRAREERDIVAVSVFVNPLQFGPHEDFEAYPRDLDRDLDLARKQGVDLVFAPTVEEMYPAGQPAVTVDPGPLAERLEGAIRPGHFRGVATVVAKLLHVVGPSTAYFGEKDAQQLAIVRRMVRDLSFPVDIAGCPIVREPDGVAMSSRNAFLSPGEREAASCLSRGLSKAQAQFATGERTADPLLTPLRTAVDEEPLAALDYAVLVDEESFDEVQEVTRPTRALVAARVGKPRLIDNIPLIP